MPEFYIHITKPHNSGEHPYYYAHDGIETCGLDALEVVQKVAEQVGLGDTQVGNAIRREVVRTKYIAAREREENAIGERLRLAQELDALGVE